MKHIFTGCILIFLDFNLNLGSSQIGLIPDFIGYIVMVNGLTEMSAENPAFLKVKPYARGMAVYTGILYVMDLLGISAELGAITYLLAITSTAVSLYISYYIVIGIKELEDQYGADLNGDNLISTWKLLAIFNIVVYLSLLLPMLAVICIIVTVIVGICFLVNLSKSKNLYYEMKERESVPLQEKMEETKEP